VAHNAGTGMLQHAVLGWHVATRCTRLACCNTLLLGWPCFVCSEEALVGLGKNRHGPATNSSTPTTTKHPEHACHGTLEYRTVPSSTLRLL
jgi:hypothetical protein